MCRRVLFGKTIALLQDEAGSRAVCSIEGVFTLATILFMLALPHQLRHSHSLFDQFALKCIMLSRARA